MASLCSVSAAAPPAAARARRAAPGSAGGAQQLAGQRPLARGLCARPPSPALPSVAGPSGGPAARRRVSAAAFQFRTGPEAPDRALAALPYLLPLLDALPFGRYVFLQFPFVARAMAPLAPLALLYTSVPFAPFLLFLAVYSFIVNNASLSRFVRVNAMQAVLLDILLIIPQVLLDDVVHPPAGGPALAAYVSSSNTIFIFVAVCVAYGMGSCAVGQTPRLPLVAEAADTQGAPRAPVGAMEAADRAPAAAPDLEAPATDRAGAAPAPAAAGALPASNLGPVGRGAQLLRLECASPRDTRSLLAAFDVAWRVSLAAFVAFVVLRLVPTPGGAWFFCSPALCAVNLGVAAALLPATAATLCFALRRVARSAAAGRAWSPRRARLVALHGAQLAATTLGLACFAASNGLVAGLARTPARCGGAPLLGPALAWLAMARWSCWNSTMLAILVRAHATTLVRPVAADAAAAAPGWRQRRAVALAALGLPGRLPRGGRAPLLAGAGGGGGGAGGSGAPARGRRPDVLVLDLPLAYHWPAGLLWLAFEAVIAAHAVLEARGVAGDGGCAALAPDCSLARCPPRRAALGLLSAELGLCLLYWLTWCWLMLRSGRLLCARPWQELRTANTLFRLERRLGLVIGALAVTPTDPSATTPPRVVTALQEFSWTEAGLAARVDARDAESRGATAGEPMFCFETAIKLFFWCACGRRRAGSRSRARGQLQPGARRRGRAPAAAAGARTRAHRRRGRRCARSCLMYEEYEGARDARAGAAAPVAEGHMAAFAQGLGLYGLTAHKVVYDAEGELKVLFAWNASTVLVAFRGSTTAANWLADTMIWRTPHPGSELAAQAAQRAGAAKVHSGFLRCWSGSGLDVRVLGLLRVLIDTALEPGRLKIYITGHSLGGALATLTAYDLAKAAPRLDERTQVSVYTYGAPRAGNRAFAAEYGRACPDTWHVINDQDTVPRGGKLISAYKRNGHRVVVNRAGDMVVRPTPLESSLLQIPLCSHPLHHLLASYQARAGAGATDGGAARRGGGEPTHGGSCARARGDRRRGCRGRRRGTATQAALSAVALAQLDRLKSLPGGAAGLVELVRDCPLVAEGMLNHGDRRSLLLWLGGRVLYTLRSRAPQLSVRRLAAEQAAEVTGHRAPRRGQRHRAAAAPPQGVGGDEEAGQAPGGAPRAPGLASAVAGGLGRAAGSVGGSLLRVLSALGPQPDGQPAAGGDGGAVQQQQQQQQQQQRPAAMPSQALHAAAVGAGAAAAPAPGGSALARNAQEGLHTGVAQAAADRHRGALPAPVSDVLGLLTGVPAAGEAQGHGKASPGAAAAAVAAAATGEQQPQRVRRSLRQAGSDTALQAAPRAAAPAPASPFAAAAAAPASPFAAAAGRASAAGEPERAGALAAPTGRLSSTTSLALALDRLAGPRALERRGASLLAPARSAPQALINPSALLAGVAGAPGGGGSAPAPPAASGSSGSSRPAVERGAGSDADLDAPINQRHLISLDVRRLSLAAELGAAAVLETRVHLPVVQELGDAAAG
ncbi:TIC20-V [Scenedesmus sp. PABB004]|nr:TIC20-V [Scenedesmus sp. PABB004]